jgi:hypothetical protein
MPPGLFVLAGRRSLSGWRYHDVVASAAVDSALSGGFLAMRQSGAADLMSLGAG